MQTGVLPEQAARPAVLRAADALRAMTLRVLILLFFIHGVIYFAVPIAVRDPTHPLKAVKYVLFLMIGLLLLPAMSTVRAIVALFVTAALACFQFLGVAEPSIIIVITYSLPFWVVVFHDGLREVDFLPLARLTLIVASVLTYVEVIVLGGIYRDFFVEGAYRATSIFVSPNMLSPMVALITYYLLVAEEGSPLARSIAIANACAVTVLSGSKTGLVVTAVLLAAAFAEIRGLPRLRLIALAAVGATLLVIADLAGFTSVLSGLPGAGGDIGVREFSLESGYIRLREYVTFLELAARWPFFPWYREFQYVDNMYLHMWGSFGLVVLLAFLLFSVWLVVFALGHGRMRLAFIFALLLVVGMSTNFVYLWPIAYVYWYLVADLLCGPPHPHAAITRAAS